MPLRPVAANPNAWDDKAYPTKFRRLDAARVKAAAAHTGLTISEFLRKATLEHCDRLGIRQPVNLNGNERAHILAVTAPQKAIEAQTKQRTNVETFRQNGSLQPSQSLEPHTQTSMGMKDTPPRL